MAAKNKGERILYTGDPEWYGYEWNGRDYVRTDEDGETYGWNAIGYDEMDQARTDMLDGLPNVINDLIISGPRPGCFGFLPDAIDSIFDQTSRWSYNNEVVERDGDLYVNDYLVRELTDKGQNWWFNNVGVEYNEEDGAMHCLETSGYTRKVFGKGGRGKSPDRSAYYDPERHPLAKIHPTGPLFTIDRGPGYGSYRYVTGSGYIRPDGVFSSAGSDGVAAQLASMRKRGDYFKAYDRAEEQIAGMKTGETRNIGGYQVTRVRNAKPGKAVCGTRKTFGKKTKAKGSAARTKAGKAVRKASVAKKGAGR